MKRTLFQLEKDGTNLLSDEWLSTALELWQGKEMARVSRAYLRMLILEIQRQRKELNQR